MGENPPPEVVRVLVTHFGVNEDDHHSIRPSSVNGRYEFSGKGDVSGFLIRDRGHWRVVLAPEVLSHARSLAHAQSAANCILLELPLELLEHDG